MIKIIFILLAAISFIPVFADDRGLVERSREAAEAIVEKFLNEGKTIEAIQRAQIGYRMTLEIILNPVEFNKETLLRGVGAFLSYREALANLVKLGYFSGAKYYDFIGNVDTKLRVQQKTYAMSALYLTESHLIRLAQTYYSPPVIPISSAPSRERELVPWPSAFRSVILEYPISLDLLEDALLSLIGDSYKYDVELDINDSLHAIQTIKIFDIKAGRFVDYLYFEKPLAANEVLKFLLPYFNAQDASRAAQLIYSYNASLPKWVWLNVDREPLIIKVDFNRENLVVGKSIDGPETINFEDFKKQRLDEWIRKKPVPFEAIINNEDLLRETAVRKGLLESFDRALEAVKMREHIISLEAGRTLLDIMREARTIGTHR